LTDRIDPIGRVGPWQRFCRNMRNDLEFVKIRATMSGVPRPGRSAADIDPDAIRNGERAAFDVLADVWLDRMHDAAQNIVGSAYAAAVTCGDVFALLWEHHEEIADDDLSRESMLLATRTAALHHLERNGWTPPGRGLDDEGIEALSQSSIIGASNVADRVEAAHAAAAVLGARVVSVADLHYRHGISAGVLTGPLKVTSDVALRRLGGLRVQLDQVLSAHFLWKRGRPNCPRLAREVDGSVDFDNSVYDVVRRHRSDCDRCSQAHRSLAHPASMFLGAPVRPLSPQIRHLVLAALDDHTDRPPAGVVVPGGSPEGWGDLTDLWEAAPARPTGAATTPAASRPASAHAVVPVRRHHRRRRVAAYVASGATAAVLMGGAVLQFGGWRNDDRTVVDSRLEPPAVDAEDPEVRSLGPIPPATASDASTSTTSTSTTSTSTTTPETTSTIPE
jgi:hypothetical protein